MYCSPAEVEYFHLAFALFWSECLSDSVRGVSWDLTLTNLFLVIVHFAIWSPARTKICSLYREIIEKAVIFKERDARSLHYYGKFWRGDICGPIVPIKKGFVLFFSVHFSEKKF